MLITLFSSQTLIETKEAVIMEHHLQLIEPTIDLKEEYISFYQEWRNSGEVMIPWVIGKDPTNFQEMVQELFDASKGIGIPETWVPDSTYWFVNEAKRIVGAVNIRHSLTDHLFHSGGHIGYGIRPTERRKGYATKLLQQSLLKAKKLGIKSVLVVCDADNIASEKTILHNGGIRDKDYIEDNGNLVRRYWITN